jgi:CRISPR-associated protein Csx17
MTDLHTHGLNGCTPTPLAGYLKALGVLRLLSTPANSTTGEAADLAVRGWWEGECFHLRTKLDRGALLRFFLKDYAPSPIIAPWNGGSGFYYREGKTGEKDAATGKMIKTGVRDAPTEATRRIDIIVGSSYPRFARLADAICTARSVISEFDLNEAPETNTGQKAAFIDRYRSLAGEEAIDWVDAAIAVTGEQFDSAALLGSGGNDGNLDFSTAFQTAVLAVIDSGARAPTMEAAAALECALIDRAITGAWSAGISQLSPGNIGAANSGNGFLGAERGDPWSVILLFEGTVAFAGTATRRGAANRARGSFPFTVAQSASGSGAVGGDDDSSNRAAELWLPLWNRQATFTEVRALLGEGRAHLGRAEARDGLTFARAVSSLGVSRGITEFARLGFEARYGNMFITVPLGRFTTPKRPRNDPIANLDAGGWLSRVRRLVREKNAPARARTVVHRFEDALFDITREDREREDLQAALAALGGVVSWLVTSREGRESVRQPPPRLHREWISGADDESPEFRVAAALASLGWTPRGEEGADESAPNFPEDVEGEAVGAAEPSEGAIPSNEGEETRTGERKFAPPMAAHFAPVDEKTIVHRSPRRNWVENDPPGVVWGAGNLVQNMIAVLDRRLIEQALRGLRDKPFAGACPARLADVATFLEGPPGFDDARCAALLAGLVWAQPMRLDPRGSDASVPLAYAALKPLFTPDTELRVRPNSERHALHVLPQTGQLPAPPGLIARLRRGEIDEAVREALSRARASGIGSPFSPARSPTGAARFGAGIKADRLAAALLVPINSTALRHLIERAYPEALSKEEADDAA